MASKKRTKNEFEGKWHITEMETWDEDYFNMEVQAFIGIDSKNMGHFQFGLVSGEIDGEIIEGEEGVRRFEFTWDGIDEMDPVNGSGWMELVEPDKIEGKIKIHQGDSSTFAAERAQK